MKGIPRASFVLSAAALFALIAAISVSGQQAPRTPSRPYFSSNEEGFRQRAGGYNRLTFTFDPAVVYTLPALIDVAESHSPETREAWQATMERAATLGIARSALLPNVTVNVTGTTNRLGVLLFDQFVIQILGIGEAQVKLDYTIFDAGARLDRVAEERSLLQSSVFSFNDTHRRLIYSVMQSYYQLLSASGQRQAAEANLRSAQAVADASQARYDNGLATLPDLSEARSAAAQANYDLQLRIGDEQKASGTLATLLTASADSQFKVQSIDELKIPDALPEAAHDLISEALKERPDLLQQLAVIDAAKAAERHARKSYYPTLTLNGDYGELRGYGEQPPYAATYATGRVYDAQLKMEWTFFDGGRRRNELRQAEASAKRAESTFNLAQDKIESEVWQAYADAETALRQRTAATALLQASQESYDMSIDAYQSGVRNVLDVLTAERQLAAARSEDVTARVAVLNSMAQISFRTGELLRAQSGIHP